MIVSGIAAGLALALLRSLGFRLAVDDLGAGYAGLTSMTHIESEYVKLDMSLVRDIDRSPKRQDLVRALVSVMCDLGIEVIAEGVERGEEADICRQLGCALGQGYFMGRPAAVGQRT